MQHRSRRHAVTVCALLLASVGLVGADWPGRERELIGELDGAPPARRVELLTEVAASSSEASEAAVVRALGDPDPGVRLSAAALVARHRLASGREALTRWLAEPQPEVRAAAARALGAIGDPAATASLVRVLGDADVRVRLAGVEAVAAIGGAEATVPLLDRLADPESTVRVATARSLGELGDARAVLSLLGLLQDSMPEAREAAATALGRLHDRRAVRGLLGLLRDPQPDVRVATARALGTLGAPEAVVDLAPLALRDERGGDPLARTQLARVAVEAIGRIGGPEARAVLVRTFRRSENDPELTRAAADAIAALAPAEARAAVPELVADPMPTSLRPATLELLGAIGGDEAADALIALYDTPEGALSSETLLRALGATGTPRALRVLLRAAGPSPAQPGLGPHAQQRRAEARRQGAIDGLEAYVDRRGSLEPEALDPLVEALETGAEAVGGGDAAVHFAASVARLIGATGNPRAPRVLAPLLVSPHVEVRVAAARALARAGVDGVEPSVAAALGDAVPEVRLGAADALGRFGGARALDALIAAWSGPRPIDHADAARAVGRVGARTHDARATALLIRALPSSAAPLAAALIDALAYPAGAGDASAVDALSRAVDQPALAAPAAEALGNAASSAAPVARAPMLARLVQLARSTRPAAVRAAAVWALGRGTEASQPTLVAALADPSAAVASNAAGALASLYASGAARPSPEAGDALCRTLSTRRHAMVRADVLEALARGGRHCRLESQRRMLLDGRQVAVRSAALDSLLVASRADADSARALVTTALEQCAGGDPDAALAARCRDARTTIGSTATAPRTTPDEPLDVVVTAADEASLAADSPYAVVLANGLVRMGWTGAGGWIHERPAPAGTYVVLDPTELPLEP